MPDVDRTHESRSLTANGPPRAGPHREDVRPSRPVAGEADLVTVWGLPLRPLTRAQAVDVVMDQIEQRRPSYVITANLHYAMLTHQVPRLAEINKRAAFVVADGAPLVWASYLSKAPLPERVPGSDLIYGLCEEAAAREYGVYLLGGCPGVAAEAGRRLSRLYPGLRVVGATSPPLRELSDVESGELIESIRAAKPDLLFVAFGQPKGELWIADHCHAIDVPVSIQVGAAFDFVAGHVRRAPRGLQRIGMEWAVSDVARAFTAGAAVCAQCVVHGPDDRPRPVGKSLDAERGSSRTRRGGIVTTVASWNARSRHVRGESIWSPPRSACALALALAGGSDRASQRNRRRVGGTSTTE